MSAAAQAQDDADWFARVPKVELHLHLEGAIPLPALWALIQKYGGDPAVPDLTALAARFQYRDFRHFIATWVWKNGFLREYEDFTLIAEAVARDLARQNIRYAEVFYSPPDFTRHGLTVAGITAAVRQGLARAPQVRVALIADLVRDDGPERAARTLSQVLEVRDQGVIGVGLGGSEPEFPPHLFRSVFQRARGEGLHVTAHAGEAAGPASVWGALDDLGVERIGHGARAIEDPALVAELRRRQVPLELCPISNLRTGVVAALAAHPIRPLVDQGLLVTVNSDDPQLFGTSLAEELRALHQHLGFTRAELQALILNGVQASWLSDADKDALRRALQEDPAWSA